MTQDKSHEIQVSFSDEETTFIKETTANYLKYLSNLKSSSKPDACLIEGIDEIKKKYKKLSELKFHGGLVSPHNSSKEELDFIKKLITQRMETLKLFLDNNTQDDNFKLDLALGESIEDQRKSYHEWLLKLQKLTDTQA